MSDRFDEPRPSTPALAGATVLQVVPALREEANARAAVNVAQVLLQSGARALVAGREGPLVADLKARGGEWVSFMPDTVNPFTRRRNNRQLEHLIGSERIDIIHAQCLGGAAAAWQAARSVAVWLVTTLPDAPPAPGAFDQQIGELARGDRIIAPSSYAATPFIERLVVPRERITVVPRSVDTNVFVIRTMQLIRLSRFA